jgi:hypothetical protein
MKLLPFALIFMVAGCATSKGNDRAAQHGADQIRMVAVQREARLKEEQAQASANEKLYEALARVAESNPDHAPSVAVALAVIGVSGGQSRESDNDRVVTLQQQRDVGLEWAKVLAPTVGTLVTGLGVAAINADVAKTQSDNSRDIQINDAEQDARIVEAVAGLGSTAVANSGMSVGGSYYDLQDLAVVDQSQYTSMDTFTETTTETSLDTGTTYDASDDGFLVNGSYDYQFLDDGATVTYGGAETNLGSIIEYLQGLGQPYSLTLDGEVYSSSEEGEGETITIDCNAPMFSPAPPECNGG